MPKYTLLDEEPVQQAPKYTLLDEEPPKKSGAENIIQGVGNLGAGLVRGAGSIGATLLAPVDIASDLMKGRGLSLQSNRERRAAMDNALESMGAETDSWMYKGGKLGGEIAGTAGVGGVLANGARIAGAAPSVVRALQTAGMTTGANPVGVGARAADLALRTGAGAAVGGASAGLVNPEDAGIGAVIGGALPIATKVAGAAGEKVGNLLRGPVPTKEAAEAIEAARQAGYVIPPSQAKPTLGNRLLEGYAGKISTAQNASARNAQVTNDLAAAALGLPKGTQITPEILADIRKNAGNAYREVSELPVNPAYEKTYADLQSVINKAQSEKESALQAAGKLKTFAAQQENLAHGRDIKLASSQPENQLYYNTGSLGRTAQSPSSLPVPGYPRIPGRYTHNIERVNEGITGAEDAMKIYSAKKAEEKAAREALANFEKEASKLPTKGEIDPGKMVFELRQARNDADSWFKNYARTASPSALKKAQKAKSLAKELQDILEGYATSIGRPDLVENMTNARQLIAKTYTVEKALNPSTGTVNASKIAEELKRGKPLTSELRQIADFAEKFPKAVQLPEKMGSLPQFSPLDWAAGGTVGALTGNPLYLGLVAGRPVARNMVLSDLVQNRLSSAPNSRLANLLKGQEQLMYRAAPIIADQ